MNTRALTMCDKIKESHTNNGIGARSFLLDARLGASIPTYLLLFR